MVGTTEKEKLWQFFSSLKKVLKHIAFIMDVKVTQR